jgi:hypothetical protein
MDRDQELGPAFAGHLAHRHGRNGVRHDNLRPHGSCIGRACHRCGRPDPAGSLRLGDDHGQHPRQFAHGCQATLSHSGRVPPHSAIGGRFCGTGPPRLLAAGHGCGNHRDRSAGATQVLTTKDGQRVVVGTVVVYRIADVVQAIGERNWDHASTIADTTQVAIAGATLAELRDGIAAESINERLTAAVRRQLRRFGVQVHRCSITDFADCRVLKLVGSV